MLVPPINDPIIWEKPAVFEEDIHHAWINLHTSLTGIEPASTRTFGESQAGKSYGYRDICLELWIAVLTSRGCIIVLHPWEY